MRALQIDISALEKIVKIGKHDIFAGITLKTLCFYNTKITTDPLTPNDVKLASFKHEPNTFIV